MIRRPPRATQSRSSAASDVYKRQLGNCGRCDFGNIAGQSDQTLSGLRIGSNYISGPFSNGPSSGIGFQAAFVRTMAFPASGHHGQMPQLPGTVVTTLEQSALADNAAADSRSHEDAG